VNNQVEEVFQRSLQEEDMPLVVQKMDTVTTKEGAGRDCGMPNGRLLVYPGFANEVFASAGDFVFRRPVGW
jgi:hypothetical protein